MNARRLRLVSVCVGMAAAPLLLGARGGCGGGGDPSDIPDMGGTWSLTFNDDLSVEVDIGGTVYNPTLAAGSSQVTLTHDGMPVSYSVDCSRELIACPSELLPPSVQITQDRTNPRQVSLEITESECRGGEIVEGTCTGTVITSTTTRNGTIAADGSGFTIVLGGGAVVAGSCALLTISVANGDLVSSGSAADGTLTADEIVNGELVTAFGGGCLLVGMGDLDPTLEVAAAGATVQLRSTYTATRTR